MMGPAQCVALSDVTLKVKGVGMMTPERVRALQAK
jgi:hypothetical protein